MATPSPPPSVGSRVVQTPELLEEILLHLDDGDLDHLRSLLHSQRVSRQFRATIQESPKLSRALFLKHTPGDLQPNTILNPFLPNFYMDETFQYGAYVFRMVARLKMGPGQDVKNLIVEFEDRFPPDRNTRVLYQGGSWQGMYLMNCDCRVTKICRGPLVKIGEWENPKFGEMLALALDQPKGAFVSGGA